MTTTFAILARVRLTRTARVLNPDLGAAIGVIHETERGVVLVRWPDGLRTWLPADQLELAE